MHTKDSLSLMIHMNVAYSFSILLEHSFDLLEVKHCADLFSHTGEVLALNSQHINHLAMQLLLHPQKYSKAFLNGFDLGTTSLRFTLMADQHTKRQKMMHVSPTNIILFA